MKSIFSYSNSCIIVFLFLTMISIAQPPNDGCANAINICAGEVISGANIGASSENCANCSDDFNFCFTPTGTVWYQFTTNSTGGNMIADISNLQIQANPNAGSEIQSCIVSAATICDGTNYNLVSNCENAITTDFQLTANGLLANTTYYIVIGGNNVGSILPAGADFDLSISGPGVDLIAPSLTIGTDSLTVCDNVVVNFQANSNCTLNATYSWFVDGELSATTTNPEFLTGDLINGQVVSATISCGDNCPTTATSNDLTISVISVDVDAGPDFTITSGEEVQLAGSSSGTVVGWLPPSALSDPNIINPIANPENTTTYTLTVTDGVCESTDDVTVTIIKDVFPFSVITPNNDGLNDVWDIEGIERFPNCLISIYDRWGQLVYQSTGYSDEKRWDGTRNGKKLAPTTYFYVIELNDQRNTINKGPVTIIY